MSGKNEGPRGPGRAGQGQVYEPIACGLHDRLEALATVGRTVELRFRDEQGREREVLDRLADVFARGGEEFVRTAGGELIRLDRLEWVDGVAFPGSGSESSGGSGKR
jgi:Rho-binding antiterminator